MIATNKGKLPIMIAVAWHSDPKGGPAVIDQTISLMPNEKIDLSILGIEIDNPISETFTYSDQEHQKLEAKLAIAVEALKEISNDAYHAELCTGNCLVECAQEALNKLSES